MKFKFLQKKKRTQNRSKFEIGRKRKENEENIWKIFDEAL